MAMAALEGLSEGKRRVFAWQTRTQEMSTYTRKREVGEIKDASHKGMAFGTRDM